MISIINFLASLDQKIKSLSPRKNDAGDVDRQFSILKKELAPYKKSAPKPTFGETVKSSFSNIKNIARNAFDNSVGYVIAKGQNWKTERYFKKNPESKDRIGYLMHGLFQNEGSQWRLARDLRKEGHQPYHLKGHHNLDRKENAEKAYGQIERFHKDTKLKAPDKRDDYFSGHSSGADMGIYMSGDKKIKQYGIKHVQARAPAPSGIQAKTLGQKLLMPLAGEDNALKYHGKKNALEMAKRKPKVPVNVIAGKYDRLVPPEDTLYKHAKGHYVIDHPDSTHFGTSGGNKEMNQIFIDQLNQKPEKKYKTEYKKAA